MMHSTILPESTTRLLRSVRCAPINTPSGRPCRAGRGMLDQPSARTAASEHQPLTARRRRASLRGARKLPQQLGAVADERHGMPRPRPEAAQGGTTNREAESAVKASECTPMAAARSAAARFTSPRRLSSVKPAGRSSNCMLCFVARWPGNRQCEHRAATITRRQGRCSAAVGRRGVGWPTSSSSRGIVLGQNRRKASFLSLQVGAAAPCPHCIRSRAGQRKPRDKTMGTANGARKRLLERVQLRTGRSSVAERPRQVQNSAVPPPFCYPKPGETCSPKGQLKNSLQARF